LPLLSNGRCLHKVFQVWRCQVHRTRYQIPSGLLCGTLTALVRIPIP
jgi:hypothetical protein